MTWSWRELVKANEGDEERALVELERMPWVGEYEDEVHQPSTSEVALVMPAEPVDDGKGSPCMWGHPRVVRNGRERATGRQKWVCRECQGERRGGRRSTTMDAKSPTPPRAAPEGPRRRCPGRGCLVDIPADRALCHFCARTAELAARGAA